MIGSNLGHYQIVSKLGEGGMGVVYKARDERLGRLVAVKIIRGDAGETERKRLWREARIAAQLNHPNLCQLYDIAEVDGSLFLVMECLEGESLAERLSTGPCTFAESLRIIRETLTALSALHKRNVIHRDLKPSNIFLTPDGVKVLDFGLAQDTVASQPDGSITLTALTIGESIAGTPYYMSPEQIRRQPLTPASDLFAAGCIFHEMLTGKRVFEGASYVEVFYGVLHRNPSAIGGSPELERTDSVIRRALEKPVEDRFPSATEMLKELAGVDAPSATVPAVSRSVTRLIVLPFRLLRPDPDVDFLAYSLPDAITSSLSSLGSLVLRSTLAGARFDPSALDPRAVGSQANVDAFVAGSLLCAGGKLRVSAQLVDCDSGNVLWSHVADTSMGDVFQLQDELTRRIVDSLMVPLTARESRLLGHDVPASAKAYEYYLRAASHDFYQPTGSVFIARDLLLECVAEDPGYAPAWARLGRVYHQLAKFHDEFGPNIPRADQAFRRAFALNPDLPLAHNLYTAVETDCGRALDAMTRLLLRLRTNSHDAPLLGGLVHACRYAGLFRASITAHQRAREIDPHIRTSVGWTYKSLQDYETAFIEMQSDRFPLAFILGDLGRHEEALRLLDEQEPTRPRGVLMGAHVGLSRYTMQGRWQEAQALAIESFQLEISDPEARFNCARYGIMAGLREPACAELERVLQSNYNCGYQLRHDPVFAPVRDLPVFKSLLARADASYSEALHRFLELGGDVALHMTGEQ
ncbi:MAG: protein kinase [Bryobacteraceae bacterium]